MLAFALGSTFLIFGVNSRPTLLVTCMCVTVLLVYYYIKYINTNNSSSSECLLPSFRTLYVSTVLTIA